MEMENEKEYLEDKLREREKEYMELCKRVQNAKDELAAATSACLVCLQDLNPRQNQYLIAINQQLAERAKTLTEKLNDRDVEVPKVQELISSRSNNL